MVDHLELVVLMELGQAMIFVCFPAAEKTESDEPDREFYLNLSGTGIGSGNIPTGSHHFVRDMNKRGSCSGSLFM